LESVQSWKPNPAYSIKREQYNIFQASPIGLDQGIKIDAVESTLQGDLDLQGFLGLSEKIRNGYEHIDVTFKIKADAPQEKFEELVELAQKRSLVFDMISHPTPVHVHLDIN
jgi:uncharacterized OsmC-like protein